MKSVAVFDMIGQEVKLDDYVVFYSDKLRISQIDNIIYGKNTTSLFLGVYKETFKTHRRENKKHIDVLVIPDQLKSNPDALIKFRRET